MIIIFGIMVIKKGVPLKAADMLRKSAITYDDRYNLIESGEFKQNKERQSIVSEPATAAVGAGVGALASKAAGKSALRSGIGGGVAGYATGKIANKILEPEENLDRMRGR